MNDGARTSCVGGVYSTGGFLIFHGICVSQQQPTKARAKRTSQGGGRYHKGTRSRAWRLFEPAGGSIYSFTFISLASHVFVSPSTDHTSFPFFCFLLPSTSKGSLAAEEAFCLIALFSPPTIPQANEDMIRTGQSVCCHFICFLCRASKIVSLK